MKYLCNGGFVVVLLLCGWCSMITVREGELGVQYVFGSLSNTTYHAGIHVSPQFLISWVSKVDIRPQTDQVLSVACGTSDGLTLVFENVDVGNTLPEERVLDTIRRYGESYDSYLVKDKIRHQMQVICASMTSHEVFNTRFHEIDDLLQAFLVSVNQDLDSGLIIDFVRLSKPVIPPGIRANYEKLAEEKTMLKVESEKQERLKKEAETQQMLLKSNLALTLQKSQMELQITAEKAQVENEIKNKRILAEEEFNKVQNRINEDRARAEANAQREQTSALQELYAVPGYTALESSKTLASAMGPHDKFFFGHVPNFLPTSLFFDSSSRL